MEIIILFFILISLLVLALVGQSFFALINGNDAIVSKHSQTVYVVLGLEKKIIKGETDALSLANFFSPTTTASVFFAWGRNQKYALVFEGRVAVAVSRELYEKALVGSVFVLEKTSTRVFYKRSLMQKPWLINWLMNNIYPAESQETVVSFSLK